MTPQDFIAQVARLIADGKDQEALQLGSQLCEGMLPKLTREEFVRVCGLMEGAQLAVDLLKAEREQWRGTVVEQPSAAVGHTSD